MVEMEQWFLPRGRLHSTDSFRGFGDVRNVTNGSRFLLPDLIHIRATSEHPDISGMSGGRGQLHDSHSMIGDSGH